MSITPSVPVLRGRRKTSLRFDGSALVLSRAGREHHIPVAAVARVRGERGDVEVVLRAPHGVEPAVHRVEDVGESAARAFAGVVDAALPEAADPAVDGSALVRVRTLDAERARIRKRWWAWPAALAFVLPHVVVGWIAAEAGSPEVSVLVGVGCLISGILGAAAISARPYGKPRWRLTTDGVTVIARYKEFVDGMYVYDFTALDGRPYAYAPHDYRGEEVEIVYDPEDPLNGVERQFLLGRGIQLFPMYLFGIPAVLFSLLTLSLVLTV
ncbi:hypothetical protein [Streptomyces sp. BK79]|uniref:hypothetical protein n=1 Tax=Streptomyces sp. BK79 TaxID=3350097 RepID=UPI00376FB087